MAVRKRANSWQYDFKLQGYRRQRRAGFKTRAEAHEAERRAREDLISGQKRIQFATKLIQTQRSHAFLHLDGLDKTAHLAGDLKRVFNPCVGQGGLVATLRKKAFCPRDLGIAIAHRKVLADPAHLSGDIKHVWL